MTKPRSIKRITCDATSSELRGLVHFCAETGQIWLHEHRMLLVHAEAQGGMRKELIDTLGMVETMLIEAAVDKAHGNLSAAARVLGLTRPQLAYRLGRLHENVPELSNTASASAIDSPIEPRK